MEWRPTLDAMPRPTTSTAPIQRRMPHVKQTITDSGYGYASTQLTYFSSFTPEGTEYTSGPFSPRSNGYCDTRVTGRDFRVKIASTQDAEWSIGEMRIDLTSGGGR